MGYTSSPPEARSKMQNNPTLLYSWWTTMFSLTIILFRLTGRYVRTECLFREDKMMALSIIPLLIRMALVHVILLYGTNNVDTVGLTMEQIHKREIGARLVLASRIFYALFIWTAKFTVLEFLKRMTTNMWHKSNESILKFIRIFLVITFLLTVIADLAECQPFTHYWQVVPDPGPKCRQGYAQLLTMGIADIITDVLLVAFPVPIIIRSAMRLKRKISLVLLFSLSVILIVITAYRMPAVIQHQGRQQYRTVWASSEMLAAAAVSNALVLGSFIRDRGVKKVKYKFGSTTDSMDRASTRRPTITKHQTDSDEDLFRGFGFRLAGERPMVPRPAPIALPAQTGSLTNNWKFPKSGSRRGSDYEDADPKSSLLDDNPSPSEITLASPRRNVSFFDVGGLLETGSPAPSPSNNTYAQDFAHQQPVRRGSRALLADLGGFLHSGRRSSKHLPIPESHEMMPARRHHAGAQSSGSAGPLLTNDASSFQDVGGLLSEGRFSYDTTTASELQTPTTPRSVPFSRDH
ncbi:MAG: hypothetical protein M1820_010316 [Bogoriella megaspora]|nr:MAG: hypothetical protein M1820_010316 [Bogoriella megaspora]